MSGAEISTEMRLREADLAGAILANPGKGAELGLEHYIKEVQAGRITLSDDVRRELSRLVGQFEDRAAENAGTAPTAVTSLPTEESLREQGRVHGLKAYEKLSGLKLDGVEEPPITDELLAKLAAQPMRSMLVLDAGHSLIELSKASQSGWKMFLGEEAPKRDFAGETHSSPQWVVVPMANCDEPRTLGLSKSAAIRAVQSSPKGSSLEIVAPDPRHVAIGILLHERETGEKLFPRYTFTNKSNVVVGCSDGGGFRVRGITAFRVDARGDADFGLAPVGIKKS